MFRLLVRSLSFLFLLCLPVQAVKITSTRVAYLDIEKVFSSIEVVSLSRQRIQEMIEEVKQEIQSGELAVDSLKNRLEAQRDMLSEEEVDDLCQMIDSHESSLKDIMEQGREELLCKEEELTLDIMKDIYEAVSQLTETEGYSLVLEKKSLLYSQDSVENITERIIAIINEKYK
ncbi:MAG: OmpH family outer membrane protein [Elusimicrobia bacterium]|nr:OmpH family outer membrane protein [Elusimicrobiota bacterium]